MQPPVPWTPSHSPAAMPRPKGPRRTDLEAVSSATKDGKPGRSGRGVHISSTEFEEQAEEGEPQQQQEGGQEKQGEAGKADEDEFAWPEQAPAGASEGNEEEEENDTVFIEHRKSLPTPVVFGNGHLEERPSPGAPVANEDLLSQKVRVMG